jgi:hypothetical protein
VLYWFLKRVLLGPILRLLFTLQVEGVEHIPADGAAILASNHLSFSDSFFLPAAIDRRVTFLAKSDYFTGRGLKGRLTAAFFRRWARSPSTGREGGPATRRWRADCASCDAGSCSASIPRARAAPTAISTAAGPGLPGWRSRARSPCSRWR